MTYLANINWPRLWKRGLWTFFFACFLALVVFMSKDMANNQPVIFGIVILAAVVTAVAFVYARYSKEALLIALCGLSVEIFLNASYWSSTIEDINATVIREKLAAEARSVVAEKRKERYAASASGKSTAQVEAEIKAAMQHERWTSSKGCTDATARESREFCRNYYLLQGDLAAAREAKGLEAIVWQTNIQVDYIPRNLAKGAMFIASLTGISVETATNFAVIALVIFMQAGLACCLRVGYAPDREPPKSGVKKTAEAASQPVEFTKPVDVRPDLSRRPAPPTERIGSEQLKALAEWKPAPKLERPVTPPDPDGGTPKQAEPEVAKDENVVAFPVAEPPKSSKQLKEELRRKQDDQISIIISEFVDECLNVNCDAAKLVTTRKGHWKSGGMEARRAHEEFVRFCQARGYDEVGKQHFGKLMRAHVSAARCGSRMHYGAVIRIQERKRKVA